MKLSWRKAFSPGNTIFGWGNMIIGWGIIWTSFNPGPLACNTMYVRPMSTSIDQDVPPIKVTIHWPRCTFDWDVPSTEVDILWPRCTFDRGRHPSAGLYLVRRTADSTEAKTVLWSPKTIRSTEDYKELGRGPTEIKMMGLCTSTEVHPSLTDKEPGQDEEGQMKMKWCLLVTQFECLWRREYHWPGECLMLMVLLSLAEYWE